MRLRRLLAVTLAATGAVAGGVAAAAGPAQAANPECNGVISLPWSFPSVDIPLPAYVSSVSTSNCEMWLGHTGEKVRVLQASLRACNGQNIAVDGSYGPATARAVRNVNGQNGIYGPKTRAKMHWIGYKANGGYACVQVG
ncbi:peptidoglycan-binding protein [Kribbella sp. NPDC048928]|uniref:peptidoglycan-binding domain-containing protein n=1 Tax=Kribbella sp. NPDC048928 TaxID=3364111 RepID=UPI00371D438A